MNIQSTFNKASRLFRRTGLFPGQLSYAQYGEDVLVASIFWYLNIPKPSYFDIGAFAPASLSNTFYFYKRGSHGVCVDANPARMATFRRARRRDICINAGVGPEDKSPLPFYILDQDSLSTFDEGAARELEKRGHARILSVAQVPIFSINTLLEKHFAVCPDFLSLDVEGLDVLILQSLDFTRHRPAVICVETVDYYTQGKCKEAIELLQRKGYQIQADTVINTIFVDELAWKNRK